MAQKIARARTDVTMRWRRELQFCLGIGFHCWAMLSRVSRHPRLRSALEKASRAHEELQLFHVTVNQRFIDAEAAWQHQIAREQASKEAALQRVAVIEAELRRSKVVLDSTFGLLQQVEADRELLAQQMKKRELGEAERLNRHLGDLHRQLDEHAGQHEADMHLLMTKEQENECLQKEVESLRFQVRFFQHLFWTYICNFTCRFILSNSHLSLQLQHMRTVSSSAISDSAENSTLALELKQQLHLSKAERLRAEEDEVSARLLHAAELLRTEQLEKANQALVQKVHLISIEAATARSNAAKEKAALLERVVLAEDIMLDWKRQYEELAAHLDQSGRLRMLQERVSAIEQRTS